MLDPRWTKIMREVDRLYWLNQTSEGRIACVTDYIIRLLNEQPALPDSIQEALNGGGGTDRP